MDFDHNSVDLNQEEAFAQSNGLVLEDEEL